MAALEQQEIVNISKGSLKLVHFEKSRVLYAEHSNMTSINHILFQGTAVFIWLFIFGSKLNQILVTYNTTAEC